MRNTHLFNVINPTLAMLLFSHLESLISKTIQWSNVYDFSFAIDN